MNDIVKIDSSESTALLSMIERVCTSKDADIDKLEKMLDMQERVMNRNAKQAFAADLALMQSDLPRVARNGEGHNKAKYAKLEDINEAVLPVLQKFGFSVTFRIKQSENKLLVVAILCHRSGHSEETELVLPLDTSGSKNAVQAVGSTISYGKRYAVCALLNISTGDDVDGATDAGLTDVGLAKQEVGEYFVKYNSCVRENFAAIMDFKLAVENNDLVTASGIWYDFPEDVQITLYRLAPTKGGILTTEERTIQKSNEWGSARDEYFKLRTLNNG